MDKIIEHLDKSAEVRPDNPLDPSDDSNLFEIEEFEIEEVSIDGICGVY